MNSKRPVSVPPLDQVNRLLGSLLNLPRPWLAVAIAMIVLSTVEVTFNSSGELTVAFRVTAITALLFALIWLPILLRIIALLGGGVKTGAGEASTPGLLTLLPKLIATLDTMETDLKDSDKTVVQSLRLEAEEELAALSPDADQAHRWLGRCAREYEEVRRVMPAGQERTFRMQEIAAKVRSLIRKAPLSFQQVRALFHQERDGNRMVALVMLAYLGYPECFDLALEAISRPHSAFEQYSALRAAQAMMPNLPSEHRQQLKTALLDQRSEGPEQYLHPENRDRYIISSELLTQLDQP